jgi:hypothetical protein
MSKLRRKPSPDLTAYQWDGDEDNIPQWVKDERDRQEGPVRHH